MTRINNLEFTEEQLGWLCEAIDQWYLLWKEKMTEGRTPHSLGLAKEMLKRIICDDMPNERGEPYEMAQELLEWALRTKK